MQTKVSKKGQTVVPRQIRKALGISKDTVLYWKLVDTAIQVFPIPAKSVKASVGILKDKGLTYKDFMEERKRERARERAAETEVK